jgi:hypothetical protein
VKRAAYNTAQMRHENCSPDSIACINLAFAATLSLDGCPDAQR